MARLLSWPTDVHPLITKWGTTICATLGASILLAYLARRNRLTSCGATIQDDPLVVKHTKWHYVRGKELRVVFMEHKLGRELPLIVFIHGMGAQLGQWSEQLAHFSHIANVLAVDLVGHGKSEKVTAGEAYTIGSITKDLVEVLDIYKYKADSFILVCHSYGCNIATYLYPHFEDMIKAIVFLCPKATPTVSDLEKLKTFIATPTPLIDLLRYLDRRGGVYSRSVNRLVGQSASIELRKRQLEWNRQHSTYIAKRVFKGAKWASGDVYATIKCPVLLIGGEEDLVCPVKENLELIHTWLPSSANVAEPFVIPNAAHQAMLEQPDVVNAIIYNWLMECNFAKMNLSYQLQLKNPSKSKWSLKNYAKWQKVAPVAEIPVRTSLFRPMKTMKQDDAVHTPREFIRRHPDIGLIVDISREAPPYAPEAFEGSTCRYQKLATTSKIPPTREEVARFNDIVAEFWRENPDRHVGV
ncbi:hypothetical protein SpCBS45565_g03230 [Spizellomyces sp. 'palustris']|nr:hypothetical protein SpCBS45565_g03230 [Spizellomyces sp. 'palustris']